MCSVRLTNQLCFIAYLLALSLTYGTLLVFNPSFTLDNFYVPALNKAFNSTNNVTLIFFNLIIYNDDFYVGFRYNAVNLTFSYNSTVLGTYTVPGFYQGIYTKTCRADVAILRSSQPWKEAALRALSGCSKAEFRVDLATDVKLRNWIWYFKHKRITAGGTVNVDDSGKKEGRESVVLKSDNNPSKLQFGFWFVGYIILMLLGGYFIVFVVRYCSLILFTTHSTS